MRDKFNIGKSCRQAFTCNIRACDPFIAEKSLYTQPTARDGDDHGI